MKKFPKIIFSLLGVLFAIFIFVTAFLPTWISTPTGSKIALQLISRNIPGKLSVERIYLSWLGSQKISNLNFTNEKGDPLLSFSQFETKTSLLYLLFGGRSFDKTILETPYLVYTQKTPGESKEGESKKIPKKTPWGSITFKDTLLVSNGTVVFASQTAPLITVSDIFVEKQPTSERLNIRAATVQGQSHGSVNIDTSLTHPLKAHILLKDFPIAILDRIEKTSLYTEALGPKLNADLKVEREREDSLSIHGSIQSAHLTASVDGSTEEGKFILNPKTHLEFTITPSFFKELIEEEKRGNWELSSKTNLMVQIEKGIFPLNAKREDFFKEVILQGKAKINRAELHHATLGSYSLKQFDINITSLNNLELSFQGDIQGKEATQLVGNLSINPQRELLFDFNCQGFPSTLLELISPPLESNIRLIFGNRFDLVGKGTYIDKNLDANIVVNSPQTELTSHITGKLPELNFEASGKRIIHGNKAKILGPYFNYSVKGEANFKENFFSIPFIRGNAFNPYFDLEMQGKIGEEGEPFSFEHLQVISSGNLRKLPIEEDLAQKTLENGSFVVQVDGSKNLITARAESQALNAHFEVRDFIKKKEIVFDKSTVNFTCELHDFPLAVISPFISEEFDLTAFFGKTANLSSKGSYTPDREPRLSIDLNAQGSGFSTSLAVDLDGTLHVRQNRPSYLYWELTPERYNALMRLFRLNPEYDPTFTLIRPAHIELNITEFICPTTPSKNLGHFICQSGFVGDLKLGTAIFRSKKTNESLVFQETTGSIKGENFSKAIELALSGSILAENLPQAAKSSFSFAGEMFNFWTEGGKLNREGLTVKGALKLDLLPVRQLTGMVPLDPETRSIVQAVLGELVNARIYGEISQMAGPLSIDIKSSNFKAKLPLRLQPHAIYLSDAVDAQITLTHAVNEILLKDVTPLFITGAYSDHPLRVHIDPQGFVLPIRPYSLEQVQIGRGIIDIGKIKVRNGGQLQALMQFLKIKEITPDGIMEAWFTPIYMTLQNGVASYQRFDALLASKVHIAMWGAINLVSGKVNMTLGIGPSTIAQRYKIAGLSKTELFQVKMTGTTTNLELDWSSASTRIAFIVARTAGGHLGLLIGGILEHILPQLGEEPSPPPTTDPLPWESIYSSDPTHKPRKSSRKSRKMLDRLLPTQ